MYGKDNVLGWVGSWKMCREAKAVGCGGMCLERVTYPPTHSLVCSPFHRGLQPMLCPASCCHCQGQASSWVQVGTVLDGEEGT